MAILIAGKFTSRNRMLPEINGKKVKASRRY